MARTEVDRVRAALAGHRGRSGQEERNRRQTLAYLDWLSDPLAEAGDPTHVTASAIIVPSAGAPAVVLHRHKRLLRWLQPGGHVDPGESVDDAALREAVEETGLSVRHPDGGPELVHIDIHQGPRGHVHLDTRWLLLADRDEGFAPHDGESAAVAWFSPADAVAAGDTGLGEAITTALERLGQA